MTKETLTIEEVEGQFSIWRDNKVGSPKIPDSLWEQVKILLQSYRQSEVLRRLKLTTQQARNKSLIPHNNADVPGSTSEVTFVQIEAQSPPISAATLTLCRGDATLTLDNVGAEQIQLAITKLLG